MPRRPQPISSPTGAGVAYAVCRPPGHHAGPAFFGGSCYLNNAAVAAAQLRANGLERVAIVDIDAHHGNGTQAIFWNDPAVFYGSVHVDPAAGWFPHTVGHADEIDDTSTNRNVPRRPRHRRRRLVGTPARRCWKTWRDSSPMRWSCRSVSMLRADDPNSPLLVTHAGFSAVGRLIAGLDRATVLVQEGGYVLQTLAGLTLLVLEGFQS